MQRTIHANEATIKTATVEIKTIAIGNKQMTLAVYRQLPFEPVMHWIMCPRPAAVQSPSESLAMTPKSAGSPLVQSQVSGGAGRLAV